MDNKYKNDETMIYVGSTIAPLYKRFACHKADSKNPEKNMKLFSKMNETDINDWYIELYEDCSCERREQLLRREGQVIREIGTLNKQIAGRTIKEWAEDNKEQLKEYHKEWREDNKEKTKEYNQEYIKENKDKIKQQTSERIFCECGCGVRRNNIAAHKQTPKHERIMKELAKKEILDEQI